MSYDINDDFCIACGICARNCPADAIEGQIKVGYVIDPTLCEECGTCFDNCPKGAVVDPRGRRRQGAKKKPRKSKINKKTCAGCQTCYLNCPQEAISFIKKKGLIGRSGYCQVDVKRCIGCGICTHFCITGAIALE